MKQPWDPKTPLLAGGRPMGLQATARALRERKLSAVAVANALFDCIADGPANVFVSQTRRRAIDEAKAADARLDAGQPASPFDGVPTAWKDLFAMAGEPNIAASKLLEGTAPAEQDAWVVEQVAKAGMVSLGRLNMSEMAYSGMGLNPHFGTPANPCSSQTAYVPGGSSSGSAVAVALGWMPFAMGTDTGGSVRLPAAYNGLVGYKSSEGRYSKQGVVTLCETLDSVGILARSVADCWALDPLFAAPPAISRHDARAQPTTFYIPHSQVLDDLDPVVASAFDASLKAIEAAGFRLEDITLPDFDLAAQLAQDCGTLTAIEVSMIYADRLTPERMATMDERVIDRMNRHLTMSAQDVARLHTARQAGVARLSEQLKDGFLLFPTTPGLAPEIAPLEADKAVFHRENVRGLRNTSIGNFYNLPGVALPNGRASDGRFSSLLVSAGANDDRRLLAAAAALEPLVTPSAGL